MKLWFNIHAFVNITWRNWQLLCHRCKLVSLCSDEFPLQSFNKAFHVACNKNRPRCVYHNAISMIATIHKQQFAENNVTNTVLATLRETGIVSLSVSFKYIAWVKPHKGEVQDKTTREFVQPSRQRGGGTSDNKSDQSHSSNGDKWSLLFRTQCDQKNCCLHCKQSHHKISHFLWDASFICT